MWFQLPFEIQYKIIKHFSLETLLNITLSSKCFSFLFEEDFMWKNMMMKQFGYVLSSSHSLVDCPQEIISGTMKERYFYLNKITKKYINSFEEYITFFDNIEFARIMDLIKLRRKIVQCIKQGAPPNIIFKGEALNFKYTYNAIFFYLCFEEKFCPEFFKSLLERGAEPNQQLGTNFQATPLFYAIRHDNHDAVQLLLNFGAKTDPKDIRQTPSMNSLVYKSYDLYRHLSSAPNSSLEYSQQFHDTIY